MKNNRGTINILAIDDNQAFTKLLSKYLSSLGYSVTVCFDGISGLIQTVNLLPDLVLVDFSMPGLNGAEVISALSGNSSTSDIPVIMLTGSELEPGLLNAVSKCGNFRGLMLKPPNFPELSEEIIKAVGLLRRPAALPLHPREF